MGNTNWRTPRWFIELQASRVTYFTLDAAASHENALCGTYCTPVGTYAKNGEHPLLLSRAHGLSADWHKIVNPLTGQARVWCNPPYFPGAQLYKWVKKAHDEAALGALVVMLLPSSTSVRWFHQFVWDKRLQRPREGVEMHFVTPRLHFSDPDLPGKDRPMHDNLLVVFHPPEEL